MTRELQQISPTLPQAITPRHPATDSRFIHRRLETVTGSDTLGFVTNICIIPDSHRGVQASRAPDAAAFEFEEVTRGDTTSILGHLASASSFSWLYPLSSGGKCVYPPSYHFVFHCFVIL